MAFWVSPSVGLSHRKPSRSVVWVTVEQKPNEAGCFFCFLVLGGSRLSPQRPTQPDRLNPQLVRKKFYVLWWKSNYFPLRQRLDRWTKTARQKLEKIQSHPSWSNTRKERWMTMKQAVWDALGGDNCFIWHGFWASSVGWWQTYKDLSLMV